MNPFGRRDVGPLPGRRGTRVREHAIGHLDPCHYQRSREEGKHADDQGHAARAAAPADGQRGPHGGSDRHRAETPERRGEPAGRLGIRRLEEIDERQPDPLEHGRFPAV